jgi:cell division initiation protein
MKIAPIDIAHKSFSRKMMGFDAEEVIDFLREVADEMEDLISERNSLKEDMREKERQINEFRERDELLKHTITTATKMSEKIHTDAEKESRLIISDAQQKSEMIIADAKESLRKIYSEISDLKRVRMQFENNLKALVTSHLTMLDQGRDVMPDPNIENPELPKELKESVEESGVAVNEDEIRANVSDAVKEVTRNLDV